MTNNDDKNNPLKAGVAGLVVGAAIGATAAVMSNKQTREQIGKKANEFKNKAQDLTSKIMDKASLLKEDAADKVEEMKDEARANVDELKADTKAEVKRLKADKPSRSSV